MAKQVVTIKTEEAIKRYWRPAMAWQYFTVCLFDFIVGPVFYTYMQVSTGQQLHQWDPITLKAAGLYHIAMGGMIGIYTWVRSLEKINMANRGIYPSSPYDQYNYMYPYGSTPTYGATNPYTTPMSPSVTGATLGTGVPTLNTYTPGVPGAVPVEAPDDDLKDPRT